MNRYVFLFLIPLFAQASFGQRVVEEYTAQQGATRYGPGDSDFFSYGDKGYTLFLPKNENAIAGTVINLEDTRESGANIATYGEFRQEAIKKGFAYLTIATGIPIDWYFSDSSIGYIDLVMKTTFTKYHLPNRNIFLLGVMTSGHRALKYVEYCKNGRSFFNPNISGVILCECAIDWVRMWYEGQKQIRDHATESSFFEGTLIHYLFNRYFQATPAQAIDKYVTFSAYSYFDLEMKKPMIYKNLFIRAYTYADIRYWFSAPGKGIYDSNYPDMSGFINEQKLIGNKNAELIVFHSNTDDPPKQHMRRQSATWDLVDKKELVEWMASRVD